MCGGEATIVATHLGVVASPLGRSGLPCHEDAELLLEPPALPLQLIGIPVGEGGVLRLGRGMDVRKLALKRAQLLLESLALLLLLHSVRERGEVP